MNIAGAPDGGNELDFWMGEWDVEWETDGERSRGTNRVSRILDQRVILEEFDGRPGTSLRGLSVTTHDPVAGWVQTCQNERPVLLRMVWDDIRSDGLTWRWERSLDGGRGWETLWRLEYRRRRPGPSIARSSQVMLGDLDTYLTENVVPWSRGDGAFVASRSRPGWRRRGTASSPGAARTTPWA